MALVGVETSAVVPGGAIAIGTAAELPAGLMTDLPVAVPATLPADRTSNAAVDRLPDVGAPLIRASATASGQSTAAGQWIIQSVADQDRYFSIADGLARPSPFQSTIWQRALLQTMLGPENARPLLLRLDPPCGGPPLLLPLTVMVERGARVARFANFGVTDYSAPIGATLCGHDKSATARAVIEAIRQSGQGIDVLRLETMLPAAGNPLLAHRNIRPSRHQGNTLKLICSVEDLLKSRGKKYRKEVERCYRLLDGEGPWRFALARTPSDIDAAYGALEAQQAERHSGAQTGYALDAPHVSAFYRSILAGPNSKDAGDMGPEGSGRHGFGRIYTLTVKDKIIAVLLCIVDGERLTLLRIANGGADWRHLSPGRLVVVEAMRSGLAEGITVFDMGIGDYAFKRGFGCEKIPLSDLTVALTLRGQPYVQALAVKARLRQSEAVRAAIDRVKSTLRRLPIGRSPNASSAPQTPPN